MLDTSPLKVKFRNRIKSFPNGTKGEEIWVEYVSLIKQERNEILLKFFGLLLSPPLTLLIVGLSLFWVVNGFRIIAIPGD
jgi:hypothetical protein